MLLVALLGLLSVAVDFRYQIRDRFRMLLGDNYDGVIEVSLFEHWHRVLHGAEAWNETAWFFPNRDTLGYNDGFLLLGLIAAPIRMLGADPFLARELADATARLIGFVSLFLLLRQAGGFRDVACCAGAALFTLWDALWLQSYHSQLLAIDAAPLILLLAWNTGLSAWNHLPKRTVLLGAACGLLYGAMLLTGFYMAWFLAFFCTVASVPLLLFHHQRLPEVGRRLRRMWPALSVVALSAVIAAVPFLLVYVPKIHETGMHGYADAAGYLRGPAMLVHVGHGNLMFGWLDRRIAGGLPDMSEATVGITPVALLLAAWGARDQPRWRLHPVYGAIALSCLVFMVLPIRLGDFSFWKLVYHAVPGAAGLRTVSRMLLFLALPAAILCAHGLHRLLALRRPLLATGLAAFVLLEQVNLRPQNAIDRPQEMRWLASISQPPSACRAFDVRGAPPPAGAAPSLIYDLYQANVPAMLIAETSGLPTVNGFSTFNPPGWDFAGPYGPGYEARVERYAGRHGILAGLCTLDLATGRWDTRGLPSGRGHSTIIR